MTNEMLVSEFKARCIAEMKKVQRTGKPLIVTLRGKPLVRVEPADSSEHPVVLGSKRGRVQLRRDLVTLDFSDDWEMNR